MNVRHFLSAIILVGLLTAPVSAQVLTFGDMDALGTGAYGMTNPTTGATLVGLLPGAVTFSVTSYGHTFPFSPGVGEFSGTDQIYVGSVQTGFHDGYSSESGRVNGPQVFSLDYSALVPPGEGVVSLTLGIAADDFQAPAFGQPFVASVNGVPNADLTAVLNAIDQGGPQVQFFTIGLDPSLASPSNVLTVTIDQGGDGGDGWAVDFLTVGITTAAVPEVGTFALTAVGLGSILVGRRYLVKGRKARTVKNKQAFMAL